MKKVYQIIHLLKLQILSSIFNHVSVKSPGFPIFLALIMFLAMPFLVAQEYRVPATPTTPFESTKDSFGVYIPEGWAIHDLNNTGSMLIQESRHGYGILAQLCLVEQEEEGRQQQEQGSLINASTTGSCQQQQQAQEEIIHIIRYPNLGARLGIAVSDIRDMIPDSILQYEIQKLQELGYRDINVISSVDTKMIVYNPGASGILATVPARIVEMIYSTDSAPNEIRRGHLYLTATNATPPSLETITRSESLPRLSPEVVQILNSFGPIPSQEIVQFTFHARAQQAAVSNQTDDAGEEPGQSTSATRYLDSTIVMLIVYSLLVIGVVWKFISYMRENHSSRLDVIS